MTEPSPESNVESHADAAAHELGRAVLGRDLNADESEALRIIFRASVQALRQGFIRRLAEHVQAERETESVEEFFGENLRTS